jgi:hypothetical protein
MEKSIQQEMQNRAQLSAKIEKLAYDIGAMQKDGRNKFSSYDYISNEQLTTVLRERLHGAGIGIISDVIDHDEIESTNDKGKQVVRTRVRMSFELTDLDTGYREMHTFAGAEQDTGGKSFQQAITQCCKYFHFKLLKITSMEEKDPDQNTHEVAKIPALTPPQKPKEKEKKKKQLTPAHTSWEKAVTYIADGGKVDAKFRNKYDITPAHEQLLLAAASHA